MLKSYSEDVFEQRKESLEDKGEKEGEEVEEGKKKPDSRLRFGKNTDNTWGGWASGG